MTRKFNVHYTCQHCGKQTTAETAFGRWMRAHPALDSVEGIVRTDADHIVCRYKTSLQGRDFQMLMVVEVKEYGAEPDAAQRDVLSFVRQLCERTSTNMHGSKTIATHKLKSRMANRYVNVKWWGVHLLQFERTDPTNGWVKWDSKLIDGDILVGILAMERRPDNPSKWMLDYMRDRHSMTRQPVLPFVATGCIYAKELS